MHCPHCAAELTENSRYCPKCGQPVSPATGSASLTVPIASEAAPPVRLEDAARPPAPAEDAAAETAPVPSAPRTPAEEALLQREIHAQLAQANLCRTRGDFSSGVDHCVAVLRAQPGNQAAHALLGDIYRDQGRCEDAIQWYRMAVDLKPNPADEAKLRHLERERDRQRRRADPRFDSAGQIASSPVGQSGRPTTGTTNLMGLSPRRWLRGITITSLAFAALVLILLIGMQISHRRESPVPHPRNGGAISPADQGPDSILPRVTPGAGPISVRGQAGPSAAPSSSAGGGFPADRPTSSSTPTAPLNKTLKSPGDAQSEFSPEVLPAPVTGVQPLNDAPRNDGDQASPSAPAPQPESPENAPANGAGQEPSPSTPPAAPRSPDTSS
jgi:hypothetical protein